MNQPPGRTARRRTPLRLLVTAAILLAASAAGAETQVIKVALVTPEGSAWTRLLREMAEEVARKTDGQVRFRIYPGGVSGDELDVLRKMRVNQIQAAGLSGVGLGVILPEIRLLEAPLLFRDVREIDRVREALFKRFAAAFESRGFVLLGFAEAGMVYFFSKNDISTPEGLKSARMWTWKGDPVAQVFLETFGISTYPLHLADVATGLETGMIDAFYSSPLAAIAFQWFTKINYILDHPIANSTGALVIRRQNFEHLAPEHQALLKSVALRYCRKLIDISRRDNAEAIGVMTQAGVRRLVPDEALARQLRQSAEATYRKNVPTLYSEDLLAKVRKIIDTARAGQ
jgi:TRAP-type C4-dicarboxylate transport system substrate-binding protein